MTDFDALKRQEECLMKQAAFKRLISNPDFQLLVYELNKIAKQATRKQLDCNPLTDQVKAAECKILRTVLTVTLPERIQAIINYQADALDKLVEPKKQWKFMDYWNQIRRFFISS